MLFRLWLGSQFPHHVARRGQVETGRWHDERVQLREISRRKWGEPAGVRLPEVALLYDTDQAGASGIGYSSTVKAESPGA